MIKIYTVSRWHEYEGYTEALGCFSTQELAEEWIGQQAQAKMYRGRETSGYDWKEHVLDAPD